MWVRFPPPALGFWRLSTFALLFWTGHWTRRRWATGSRPTPQPGPRDVPWTWVGLGNIMTLQALHRSSGPPHGLMPDGGN